MNNQEKIKITNEEMREAKSLHILSTLQKETANKHMRRCSTKVVIRGMQIKTMRYCYTSTRTVKIKKADHSKFLQGCEAIESHTIHGNVK